MIINSGPPLKNLLWNFQLAETDHVALPEITMNDNPIGENLRWEKRFFWRENVAITLYNLGENFLNFASYKFKKHNDSYIILPNENTNLKIRNNKIILKPLLKIEDNCFCYGKKILISTSAEISHLNNPNFLSQVLKNNNVEINQYQIFDIYKETFTYTNAAPIKFKLEFSRLGFKQTYYLSFSIEAQSQSLLKTLAALIIPNVTALDYISFLKTIK